MSLNYVMIGSNDLARSRAYYDAVMPHVGAKLDADYPGFAFSYKMRDGGTAWVAHPHNKQAATPGNGATIGLLVESEEAVHAAHAASLANGGTDEGAPGPRPDYGPEFVGGYVRDPDGNKMSFVFYRKVDG